MTKLLCYSDCYEGISDVRCLCSEPGCSDGLDCGYMPGRFLCDCYPGYTGLTCDVVRDYCEELNPCKHGMCQSHVGGYTCQCDQGWFGKWIRCSQMSLTTIPLYIELESQTAQQC